MSATNEDGVVLEKNAKVANMWSSGGRAYDAVSQGVAEGIRHCVMRLAPQKDENILDIATGTGLTARTISHSGCSGNWHGYRGRTFGCGTATGR